MTTCFANTSVEYYKKGIKVVPEKNHPLYGTPEITLKGKDKSLFWNHTQSCWFGSKKIYQYLISLGASQIDYDDESPESIMQDECDLLKFFGATLKLYKKGIKVTVPESHELFGVEQVKVGPKKMFWNDTHSCWFGSKDSIDSLVSQGATWPSQTASVTSVHDFSGATLKLYKKGIKVTVPESHELFGVEQVKVGPKKMFWNDTHSCWFGSKDSIDTLVAKGAAWPSHSQKTSKSSYVNDTTPCQKFSDMEVVKHGKGYLLVPPSYHADVGTKYYHNGWWMASEDAWFFKSEYFNDLMINGAQFTDYTQCEEDDYPDSVSEYSEDYEELSNSYFKDMILKEHKNGLLLVPPKKHKDYGEKYYNEGFWNTKLGGWVFSKKHNGFLVNHGALKQ